MAGLFVDTAGWGNLVDPSQPYHRAATALYRDARVSGRPLVTTTYVVAELVALLTSPLHTPRPRLIAFVNGLKRAPHVQIVHIDPTLDDEAWNLLERRPDKAWSLVDCASFVLMEREGITDALTSDHHFAQAGFVPLLR